jgi:endonuclease/exonuclease/phosphatase family metal-dependent hydrolase
MMKSRAVVILLVLAMVSSVVAEVLSIATWNIWTIEVKRVYQVERWNKRFPYMVDFFEMMDCDVMGLQEATAIQIDSLISRLPQYRYVGVASRDGKKSGNFSPIFYKPERVNLIKSNTFWLSETPNKPSMGWDANSKRICTWALFQDKLSNQFFAVFNTHLDHIGENAPKNGMNLILDSLGEYLDIPVFLTGDFNVEKGSELYNEIEKNPYLEDSYNRARKKLVPSATFNANDFGEEPRKIIDFIFVNKRVDVSRYDVLNNFYWDSGKQHYYSDHFPVRLLVNLVN